MRILCCTYEHTHITQVKYRVHCDHAIQFKHRATIIAARLGVQLGVIACPSEKEKSAPSGVAYDGGDSDSIGDTVAIEMAAVDMDVKNTPAYVVSRLLFVNAVMLGLFAPIPFVERGC